MDAALEERRARFLEINDTDAIALRIQRNRAAVSGPLSTVALRKMNATRRKIERDEREIRRRHRKRQLFDEIETDIREAQQIARQHRRTAAAPAPEAAGEAAAKAPRLSAWDREDVDDAVVLLEDVMLIDDGERVQDARTQVDDVCCNCGTQMERNLRLSFLVCPNLDCGYMRWYIDTSAYNAGAYTVRSEIAKNNPKAVTHFSTFLNTAQGKTTKKFPKEYLMRVCFYCYVEGCRTPADINKDVINKAQRYFGDTDYALSVILKTQLRGNGLLIPPEITKRMQLLFKAIYPVFETLKHELHGTRRNMINFNFISRILCRLLGYDVFLPLFDQLRMQRNRVRHSAFVRRMFQPLGWHWEDGRLTEIPDAVLDEFDERMAAEAAEEEAAITAAAGCAE